jgi:hypothetical protein
LKLRRQHTVAGFFFVGESVSCRRISPLRYAALYLLKAFLTNEIVEATGNFRLFEGIGVVRGRGRAKLSEKRMHFVREKRDKPAGRRFHAGMRVAKSFVLSKVLKFYG